MNGNDHSQDLNREDPQRQHEQSNPHDSGSGSGSESGFLGPPASSTAPPPAGRKRGLSLRSQLFNKAFAGTSLASTSQQTPPQSSLASPPKSGTLVEESQHFASPPIGSGNGGTDFELQNFTSSSQNLPEISIEPPQRYVPSSGSDTSTTHQHGDDMLSDLVDNIAKYQPYQHISRSKYSNPSIANSTTELRSAISNNSESEEYSIPPRRKPHSKFVSSAIKLSNKIRGIKNIPPSKDGRVIPIALDHTTVNYSFRGQYYDPATKQLIDERTNESYCDNIVTSAKYNIYTFLPKQIKAQFSKLANCYFMTVAIMQMIPSWSTTGKFTTIVPLLIFMSISIAREGFDDWKRHGHDNEENNKLCTVLKESQDQRPDTSDNHSISTIMTETIGVTEPDTIDRLKVNPNSPAKEPESTIYTNRKLMRSHNIKECPTKWKRLKVGDIVKIHENEWFPADILLLGTSSETQECYVETMALDGETNLKQKHPQPELSKTYSTVSGLKNNKSLVTVEDPNLDLYNFEGRYKSDDGKTHALGSDNVVYRGSILRNTKSIVGVIIFSGEETKIRMNNIKNPRVKSPKLQKNINYIVLFMVGVVILLSAFSTMAERILYNEKRSKNWYIMDQDAGVAPTLMSFIIMYNTLIPLSLYVTMEIIKVMQLVFLQNDIDMYHIESDTPADAKTATILEELGQVGYVFSDKTGTLTDNLMIFRKFSVCGVSWIHDLDVSEEDEIVSKHGSLDLSLNSGLGRNKSVERAESTTKLARKSMDARSIQRSTTWKSTAHPSRSQDLLNSLELLKYIQTHPQTLFSKKAKFFLLSIAICNTCLPKKATKSDEDDESSISRSNSVITLPIDEVTEDDEIDYQAASPDELALVQAARDLGFVVFDRKQKILKIKTYPEGFENDYKIEEYEILDVIEFSSARKRMSVVVKFPDGRICVICKGADNVILERLKNRSLAMNKAKEIAQSSNDRKTMEADAVLQTRLSQDLENNGDENSPRNSLSSLRRSLSVGRHSVDPVERMNSIDNYLMNREDEQLDDIASRSRNSLKSQQRQKYKLGEQGTRGNGDPVEDKVKKYLPNDKLLVNDEFLIEKTLEHIEEFSTEGLRTLLYSFKWVDKSVYEDWSGRYSEAKTALVDRSNKVEEIGSTIEQDFELLGASAIEDKLQDGVSETIDKLRRAGIKMWMLTGDKRETAINIGYSCRLIKDYSTVVILSQEEGKEGLMQRITSASLEIRAGRVAHCVVVIDGATLADFESDLTIMSLFIEFCVEVDSAIVCRASPSQKASMVSSIRNLKKDCVTLAIGDGANDIAMIQSADIGVGITGKEGLQAARSSDYAIAQFRFLLKLLLVNGRYNYIRTSKFVLCTFYKELMFYLTQAVYQRHTLFSGSSMYEPWSLSMFNTLFTSLCVLCVGMFDRDLKPATLIAIPELYSKGREYKAFNLKVFIVWMLLAALQSMFVSFTSTKIWGYTALRDNTTFPLGTLLFGAMVVIINVKCELIEMQNRQWPAFAAFIISVGGYICWNVLIMFLYRAKQSPIFFVDYGLTMWGQDQSWWASLLVLSTIPILFDILLKVFKFMFRPSDDELFKFIEKDTEMRRLFEEKSWNELKQGWTMERQPSTVKMKILELLSRIGFVNKATLRKKYKTDGDDVSSEYQQSAMQRKRAGTLTTANEPSSAYGGEAIYKSDVDVLPSGKRVRKNSWWTRSGPEEDDIEAIMERRLGRGRTLSEA